MLEAFLIIGALYGGPEVQNKTGEAYLKYSGIDVIIQEYGEKNPELAFIIGSIGLARSKHLYYQVKGPFFHDITSEGQTLWFKKDF